MPDQRLTSFCATSRFEKFRGFTMREHFVRDGLSPKGQESHWDVYDHVSGHWADNMKSRREAESLILWWLQERTWGDHMQDRFAEMRGVTLEEYKAEISEMRYA